MWLQGVIDGLFAAIVVAFIVGVVVGLALVPVASWLMHHVRVLVTP